MRRRAFARIVSALMVLNLVWGLVPAPARAMSTDAEIKWGKQLNDEVDSQSVLVTDPFLTNWVNSIGAKLAAHRARTAITYNFEIIDSNEINSFALPGGFIHVDMGLLNFASSDDQVAGVMGHEMGHVERGHVTSLNNKGNILSILIGVLSILNPIGYLLGGTAGDLAYLKFSRLDELQADQYGLLLMSEAGYDPRSDVDTFVNLAKLSGDDSSDKYFRDHPAPLDRVSHLLGYPELSQATADTIATAGLHDVSEGRYTYGAARLKQALASAPAGASVHTLAQSSVASLAVATGDASGSQSTASAAAVAAAFGSDASALEDAATALVRADNVAKDDEAAANDRANTGGREIENYVNQLESLSSGAPNLGQPSKKGNNLSFAVDGLNRLTRDINGTIDLTSDVMGTAPGLIDDTRSTLKSLADPLRTGGSMAKYRAAAQWYPSMTAQLSQSADDLLDCVDRARAAISTSEDSIRVASAYFAALNKLDTSKGDIADKDMPAVKSSLAAALSAWDASFAAASKASNEMYAAQTRSLSAQVTMLDLLSSQARYDTYRKALAYRFPGVDIPEYATVMASGVSAGDLGSDAWYAYETKRPLSSLLAAERSSGESAVEHARADGLFAESMEIAEGLLLEDYTETPPALPKGS